ncbi:MAG TPA: hypothetical protein VFJ12_00100 [Segeticoccus sp.]|nr:hypothetical protein [Segeticoccus sp.]
MPRDPDLPPLFSRTEAIAAGMTRHQVANRVRTQAWRALRRDVYCRTALYDELSPRDQHLLAVLATLRTRGDDELASHLSAACVLDLPLPLDHPDEVVTLTCTDISRSTRHYPRLLVQVASTGDRERTVRHVSVAGHREPVRMTTAARTVADNLRHLHTPDGVALADAALRRELTSHEAVSAALDRQSDWPYAERGHLAARLVDPRRETWLESHSFVRLHLLGLPMPEPQVVIRDGKGEPVARVDGWFDDCALVLEADGREKYFLGEDGLPPDLDAGADELRRRLARSMEQQSRRERTLRDLGVGIERWGTNDAVRHTRDLLARLQAARARGDRSRFRGHTTYLPSPPWLEPARRRAS